MRVWILDIHVTCVYGWGFQEKWKHMYNVNMRNKYHFWEYINTLTRFMKYACETSQFMSSCIFKKKIYCVPTYYIVDFSCKDKVRKWCTIKSIISVVPMCINLLITVPSFTSILIIVNIINYITSLTTRIP